MDKNIEELIKINLEETNKINMIIEIQEYHLLHQQLAQDMI